MSTATVRHSRPAGAVVGPVLALWAKSVRDRWLLATVVGAVLIGMGAMVGALWPSMQTSLADLSRNLPAAFTSVLAGADMSTPSGWVNAELMSLIAPAAMIAVAVISGTRATAGEEEDKTLGLLLGAPVGRTTFLLAKAAAVVAHVLVVGALLVAGLYLGDAVGGLGLTTAGILGAALHTALLGLFFGAVAVTAGTALGARRPTYALTGGLAAVAFAMASFLPLSDGVATWAKASPWYFLNSSDPLQNGPQPWHLLVLGVLTAAVLALGIAIIDRRDLRG